MRIDKFLKVSRILKRRSVSKDLAEHDRVLVNGRIVKPSYQVSLNDEVSVLFGNRKIVVRILDIADHKSKEEAKSMYEIISDEMV